MRTEISFPEKWRYLTILAPLFVSDWTCISLHDWRIARGRWSDDTNNSIHTFFPNWWKEVNIASFVTEACNITTAFTFIRIKETRSRWRLKPLGAEPPPIGKHPGRFTGLKTYESGSKSSSDYHVSSGCSRDQKSCGFKYRSRPM